MRIRATLIKTISDDGHCELTTGQTGDVMTVELQSIRVSAWGKKSDPNFPLINRFSIFVYDCAECENGGWQPLEFFKLEAD